MLARPVPQSSSQQQSVSLQPSFKGCIMQVRLNDRLLPFIQMPDYGANDSTQIFDLKESRLELDRCRTCFDGDCHNNGRCDDNFDGFQCECPSTFIGARCELDNDECTSGSNPCRNGHCKNLHGGFECICNPGYGGEKCTEITDTCLAKKPCQNGGICKTISGQAFICECLSSHFGRKCEKPRTCINECRAQHSHCVNNSTCACLPGPKAERTMCQFIASCEHMSNLCQNGGTCVNKDGGGYVCLCPDLYQGLVCELHVAPSQPDLILLLAIATACLLIVIFVTVSTMVIRGVRRARATRGIYSPSRQEMFGNSASDILKPPPCERLI
ncbi:Protein crumbs [Fragariocoptes setiger]|uniref:Protein crumbs n=1 Tax=Fragariocoptes setiger TaxID=1670756 RepID=A0ABQ7SB18_9ACAR|nr:Protein crumbs [Fragariocoptes setiger]